MEKVEEIINLYASQKEANAVPKSIRKLEDVGMFTIYCSLGDLKLDDALVDSCARINVIILR